MATEQVTTTGFAVGELLVLRPVLEGDLAALAHLLADNPSEPERLPWTHQRLKQKFEDKDAPGLWDEKGRKYVFAAVRKDTGELAGYLREREDYGSGIFWSYFHIADGLEGRAALAADLLKAYHAYKLKWHDPLRLSFDVLGCEEEKAAWLTAAGFELELKRERMVLWLGQPQSVCTYTWLSERLKSELAKREVSQ
jgi:hypothetical protein